jgi:hypothetical protein|tara:strand:- start:15167 stop:15283 length:117 start_codon:yes stop_codon:yes gene_type:complete
MANWYIQARTLALRHDQRAKWEERRFAGKVIEIDALTG